LRFPLWQQAAQVAVLLLFCAALVALVRVVGGAPLPRWNYVVGSLTGALLWPLLTLLLLWPQRPSRSTSEL
jgi:rod shape-determining protein MreD